MRRRQILRGVSCGTVAAIAGCLGGDGDDGSGNGGEATLDPDPDAAPEELLPSAPDGWTEESSGAISIPPEESETGGFATFTDSNGSEYRVEVLKFAWGDDAASFAESEYQHWSHHAVVDRFAFGCRVDSSEGGNNCDEILASSAYVGTGDIEESG